MEYRILGRTNLKVSAIGFGGLPLFFQPVEVAIEAINIGLDKGINYFDLDEGGNQFLQEKVYLVWIRDINRRPLLLAHH